VIAKNSSPISTNSSGSFNNHCTPFTEWITSTSRPSAAAVPPTGEITQCRDHSQRLQIACAIRSDRAPSKISTSPKVEILGTPLRDFVDGPGVCGGLLAPHDPLDSFAHVLERALRVEHKPIDFQFEIVSLPAQLHHRLEHLRCQPP